MSNIKLYDRSRSTTDWQCPRRRYWNYEYLGKGIVPDDTPQALYMGTTVHDALSAIARLHLTGKVDIDLIADTARKQMYEALIDSTDGSFDDVLYANEQAALVEGLVRGFYRRVWPTLIEEYPNILAIEQEMTYVHDGFGKSAETGHTFMAKPDLVLGDNDDNIYYIEYKTTSSKKEGWINSWNTAVQLHSTSKAIERTLGKSVTAVIVQGIYKGYESYNKQNSPFCYAYMRGGNPPFVKPEISYEYKAGFKKSPVWDLDGGMKAWVASMPENILTEQFPRTPPIFINEDLVETFFAQRFVRETEIDMTMNILDVTEDDETKKMILNSSFPQRFDQCSPGYGSNCPYRAMKGCHGVIKDPLNQGYILRESHHQPEVDMQKEGIKKNESNNS